MKQTNKHEIKLKKKNKREIQQTNTKQQSRSFKTKTTNIQQILNKCEQIKVKVK
jgi:hypothetical protein